MLKNDLVLLRAIEPEDLSHLYAWENNTENWDVSSNVTPYSKFILKNYIETSHQDIYTTKQFRFMICTLDGIPVGTIDLFDFDPYNNRAGVGVLIAETESRGKGLADAALKLLISYSKLYLKLNMLFCNISEENTASIKLFERNSFECSGKKIQWNRSVKGFTDELFYQIIL